MCTVKVDHGLLLDLDDHGRVARRGGQSVPPVRHSRLSCTRLVAIMITVMGIIIQVFMSFLHVEPKMRHAVPWNFEPISAEC